MTTAIVICAVIIGGLYWLMSGTDLVGQAAKLYFGVGFFTYLGLHYGGVWMFDRFLQAWAPGYESSLDNPFLSFVTFPVAIIASMVIYGPIKRLGKRLQITPEHLRKEKEAIESLKGALKAPGKTERYNKNER